MPEPPEPELEMKIGSIVIRPEGQMLDNGIWGQVAMKVMDIRGEAILCEWPIDFPTEKHVFKKDTLKVISNESI